MTKFKKSLWVIGISVALTSLTACHDKYDFYDPDRDPNASGFANVSANFDWSVSQDVTIQLKSDVTTRVFVYEDAKLEKLMGYTVLEKDTPTSLTFTTLKSTSKIYLAYLNNEGKTAIRTVDINREKILTRAANISGTITDAAETLPSIDGNKTTFFSPNKTAFGTVLFEDMYPQTGDYDMNDFVIGYKKQYGCTETTETLEIILQIRAIGGKLPFVPGLEIMDVDVYDLDISWTSSDPRISVENVSENDEFGTPVFRLNGAQNLKDEGTYFNVNQPMVAKDNLPFVTIKLTRSLEDHPQLDIRDKDLNFFIYNTQSKVEIHEKNTSATRFASNSDEKSFHKNGLVWAFRVEGYMPHTIEGNKIDKVFPKINGWMKSNGKQNNDWIKDFKSDLVIDYSQEDSNEDDDSQKQYITINATDVKIGAAGGEVEVPVNANCDFDVNVGESGWIYDFVKQDGKVKLYVYNNYNGADKSATVTLTSTSDINTRASFNVSQKGEAYAGTQIQSNESFRNNVENLVKANGGTIDDVKTINIIGHSDKYKGYSKADLPANVWDITINNNYKDRVYMEWDAANATITVSTPGSIVSTGNTCSNMFKNCSGLENVDLSGLDISLSTSLNSMFFQCKKLKKVDLTPLNTTNVTNMSGIFTLCESLENVLVNGLNTANVTTMNNIFDRCYSLKSADISSWNTQNVTTFKRMFYKCNSISEVKLKCSKTSLAESGVEEMFNNCYMLTSVDMSAFDFNNANNFTSIFCDCKSLQTVIFGKSNTSKIKYMKNAFMGTGGYGDFTCVNADFSSAENMDAAFKGSTAKSINLSGWKTPNVQVISSLFHNCTLAKKINISGWSVDNVSSFTHMFNTCDVIEEIDLGTSFNIPTDAYIDYLFYCTAKTSKKTTVKCTRATYDAIMKHITNTNGGGNSKTFLNKYCTFSIYE